MKFSRRERRRVGLFALIIFYLIIFLIIYELQSLYSVNLIWPSEDHKFFPMALACPATSNGQVCPTILTASFVIESNGTIAEGTKLRISQPKVLLYIADDKNKNLIHNMSDVEIGFQYTQNLSQIWMMGYDTITKNTTFASYSMPRGLLLAVDQGDLNYSISDSRPYVSLLPILNSEFYFPVAGDYSPVITIAFQNGSRMQYKFDEIKLHVISKSEMQTMGLNQINVIVAIALLVFSFIEGLRLIKEWSDEVPEIKQIDDPEYQNKS